MCLEVSKVERVVGPGGWMWQLEKGRERVTIVGRSVALKLRRSVMGLFGRVRNRSTRFLGFGQARQGTMKRLGSGE
jgi:hypothetical protein